MKNKFMLLGLVAIAAMVGFSFASCSDDPGGNELNGTWVPTGEYLTEIGTPVPYDTIKLDNGKYEQLFFNDEDELTVYVKGTYTASEEKITLNRTHVHGTEFWIFYSFDETWLNDYLLHLDDDVYEAYLEIVESLEPSMYSKEELKTLGFGEDFLDEWFFAEGEPMDYTLEGDVLTIDWGERDHIVTYNRQ